MKIYFINIYLIKNLIVVGNLVSPSENMIKLAEAVEKVFVGIHGQNVCREPDIFNKVIKKLNKEIATLPAPGCRDDILQAPRITGVSFDRSPYQVQDNINSIPRHYSK